MSLWKRVFGERLPIDELCSLQGKLEEYGMTFLFRDLVRHTEHTTQGDIRRAAVDDILINGKRVTRVPHVWIASGDNTRSIGYQPKGNWEIIWKGQLIVFEVGYEEIKKKNSHMQKLSRSLEDDIRAECSDADIIEDLLSLRIQTNAGFDYASAISLVNVYLNRNPDLADTMPAEKLVDAYLKA
jgi:hypothetical protein